MPDQPLNPDALEAAADAVIDASFGQELPEAPIDLARAAVSAYLAHARPVVSTLEELDKLPYGSLIFDNMEEVGKVRKDTVYFADSGEAHSKAVVAELFLPATVLYTPEGGTE